ncbi:uncharacterized protein LOC132786593 [Drosophila nasuta]|uniref:uncharacterized protein LOC132786593 n=1 Tax=Drosophila nasuta TaxID=42062 RepID=UPI00295ED1D2|nr:uncharacterized protein LOC132786593 [Drosophila nasuta]
MSSDSMFKYFIFCLALCSLVYADGEWVPKTSYEAYRIMQQCLSEHPFNKEQLAMIMQNFFFPNEPEVRQHLLCYYQMHGLFSTLEGFHPDRVAKIEKLDLNEEEVLQIAQGCVDRNEQKSPADEWVFRFHICLMSSKVGDRAKIINNIV